MNGDDKNLANHREIQYVKKQKILLSTLLM